MSVKYEMGDEITEVEELERIFADTRAEPIKISYAAIKYITKNFAQLLGTGGFGVVYLGGLRNGMVAVKKLLTPMDHSDRLFFDEVFCLAKVNHKNVVRFLAYCLETTLEVREVEGKLGDIEVQQRFLCFEYAPNGNLHHYLQEKTHGHEWSVRYAIIKGICHGLHCIHEERIVHLDLKPANVLLGANMEPKISDFGLSRRFDENVTKVVTEKIAGTLGYIAPEYIDQGKISLKTDIFSLGIIMIRLLVGHNDTIIENWHETMDANCPKMKRCIEIAQICVDHDPCKRPTMYDIICALDDIEITVEEDPPIINEPRNDPMSSLYQVVLRFRALLPLGENSRVRVDTLYIELDVPECIFEGISKKPGKLSFQLLQLITRGFSDERRIGFGGFGIIYRGTLALRNVAVKRRHRTMDIDDSMFHNEIKTTMLAQHKNVVQFLGYCCHTEEEAFELEGNFGMAEVQERLLCFEYLRKGSLDRYVSDASCGLEWRTRYQIIKGICEGLHNLHKNHIVHLDIKPDNILLDDNMAPKIADFGISRRFGENQSQTITENMIGSRGYMAPEFYEGVITFKTDIYSLGVTITQILIGKKYCSATDNVLESWRNRLAASLEDTILLEQVRVCAEISEACINGDPAKRPDTWRIIEMLVETETDDGALAVMDKDAAVFDKVHTVSMELDVPECIFEGSKKPGNLSYQLLRFITGKFSEEQIIGKTGFANIFKGTLGLWNVAVKSYRSIHIDDRKFHNEVKVTLLAQHKNIVQYLGYCSHTEVEVFEVEGKFVIDAMRERLLCFEYLRNGSLDGYVSDASCGLEWRPRYKIIRGICEGLHYLHEKRIIHLDLNPASILLDDNMVPKLGDFFLSRFLGENESQITATSSFGTRGYMAPELLDTRVITFKSDIYSLGVTITEILIGQKHYSAIENVLECWKNRLLHMSSADMVLLEQVRVCAEISRACIGDDPDKRPDMRCLIEMLDEAENNVDALYVELDVMERILEGSKKPSILSHQLLLFITGIFSREQEIGRSEYAITYRGILRQRSVAVKRLLMTIGFNDQMFQNQIKTMTLAQHKNIVQFLGYCSYTQQEAGEFDMADMRERLLCFEDLSNGSLDRYVSDASLGFEWSVRYQIIMGICEGLHYLHGKKIVLGELRTTNILLDDKMVPKIDIFCLSRCFVEHQSRVIAPIKMESMGYMAPEAFAGFITFMSDIYSLGIIITEILTERKDLAKENVLESWRTKLGTSSTDVLLEQVRVCAEISMACKNPNPERRPDMQRIIKMLDETESKGPAEQ